MSGLPSGALSTTIGEREEARVADISAYDAPVLGHALARWFAYKAACLLLA